MGRLGGAARAGAALRAALLAAGAGLVLACASSPDADLPDPDLPVFDDLPVLDDVVHVVRKGENVYRIARYYGVRMRDVIRANRIRDVRRIPVGARLRIPGARRRPPDGSVRVASLAPTVPRPGRPSALREADLEFDWPLARRRLSSHFGWRRGRRHEGIDLAAPGGTPIRAAEAGRVIHAGGGLGGYGRTVIVRHAGLYSTVYAHARRILVRRGQRVEKGELLAEVGATGRTTGAHLHFEVRRGRTPLDPLHYLP